jgi:hypothetical protein
MPTDIYGDLNDMMFGVNASGDVPGGGAMGYPARSGPPRGASWLDYLGQMFGVSPAAAAEAPQGLMSGQSRAISAPPAPNYGGGGWGAGGIDQGTLDAAKGAFAGPPGAASPFQPPGRPMSGPPGSLNPTILGSMYNMPTPSGGGGGAALAAANAAMNPNAPAQNAQPVSARTPVPGPLASGGATGASSSSNPRFVPIDRPNMDAAGGARRGGGPAQMTALNLAGLFGGGQQQAANPANVPAPNAQPVSGPLAKRPSTLNLPTSYNIPGSGYRITPQGDVIGTLWGRSAGGNPY